MKKLVTGMAAILVLGGLAGCGQQKPLTVGTVDTPGLVQSDPQYQELAVQYLKERGDLQDKLEARLERDQSEAARKDAQKQNKELDDRWFGKTQKFLDSRFGGIQKAAEEVCKEKDIDLVLVDTANYPTVEWGAVNITQDIELKLQKGSSR